MALTAQGFRRDVGGEVHTQTFAAVTPGEWIDIGAFALKSVQLIDGGSFGGTVNIEVSNDGVAAVVAANGSALGAGVLINIAEDALKARINPAGLTAGTLKAVWCLSG